MNVFGNIGIQASYCEGFTMNEHFSTLTVKVFPLKGFALYSIIVVIFCRSNRFYTQLDLSANNVFHLLI